MSEDTDKKSKSSAGASGSSLGGKAAIAGAAIGSAAIAAALLYASKRKKQAKTAEQHAPIPTGEAPETD